MLTLCFVWRISMFSGIENYVLLYKSAHYEVIPDYGKRTQYSVHFRHSKPWL